MKKILFTGICAGLFSFGATGIFATDLFDGFVESGSAPVTAAPSEQQAESRSERVTILQGGHTQNFDLEKMSELFPKADYPERADLHIRFDDLVVNSFSDHLRLQVSSLIQGAAAAGGTALIRDMLYNIYDDKFRVTVLLDWEELIKKIDSHLRGTGDSLSNIVNPSTFAGRNPSGDRFVLAVDIAFTPFAKSDQDNVVLLTFQKPDFFFFWEKGADGKGINMFRERISLSVEGKSQESLSSSRVQIDKKLAELRIEMEKAVNDSDLERVKAIMAEQKVLEEQRSSFAADGDSFQSVREMPSVLSPQLLGTVLAILQEQEAFNKYLKLTHYYGESAGEYLQIIEVSELEKALRLAIPDFAVNYVDIVDRKLVFTGKVAGQ
jgi:hypothetical protein